MGEKFVSDKHIKRQRNADKTKDSLLLSQEKMNRVGEEERGEVQQFNQKKKHITGTKKEKDSGKD